MGDAPKRIWASKPQYRGFNYSIGTYCDAEAGHGYAEYVRADIANDLLEVLKKMTNEDGVEVSVWDDALAAIAKAEAAQ